MLSVMDGVKGITARQPASRNRPPVVRTRRPKREAVRRRLLDAALEVFAERGFDHASLDEVAEAAGLTKGAIYSNFASKDDLFFAMMTDQVLNRIEIVRGALAAGVSDTHAEQALYDVGRLLTQEITEQREWQLVFLDFWRRAVRDDDVRAQFVAHRRALRAAIADGVEKILEQVPNPGELTVEDVVTVVLALSNGLAIEQYIDPELLIGDLFGRILSRLSG
jgi:AcrR family transcriptional regulator